MRRALLAGLTVFVMASVFAAEPAQRTLTFEDRVTAQRAVEQVLWRHRVWPKENTGPKPSLGSVMSDDLIRAKVRDYLTKSNALASIWSRPILAGQLQAEMDRMARATRDPSVLRELFGALNNDPFLIAEILARQTLAERLVRTSFASDERVHGDVRRNAESALAECQDAACMKTLGGEYQEAVWQLHSAEAKRPDRRVGDQFVQLSPNEWDEALSRLAHQLGGSPTSLPLGKPGTLEDRPEGFIVTAVLAQTRNEVRTARVIWHKTGFDTWWSATSGALNSSVATVGGPLRLPAVRLGGCADDSWRATPIGVPDPRRLHTAVWTGAEMIVWGGEYGYVGLNTGGRYNPATDTWEATSTGVNVPSARFYHSAVWTGTEMIVWGGGADYGDSLVNTGGRYNPSTDSWEPTALGPNVPSPRTRHTAVWTGSEMIIWGGGTAAYGGGVFNSGGRYDPSSDTWTSTSTGTGVPSARSRHSAIWTGSEMIVWGGDTNTGGRYDPATDSWASTSTGTDVPSPRAEHSAVWTGEKMIVWGGEYGYYVPGTGGRYDPITDAWEPTSTGSNAPDTRYRHAAVWTGTEMIIWGGSRPGGARYDPVADTWSTIATAGSAGWTYYPTAVWTGSEMIVWGGVGNESFREYWFNVGGRYDPSTNTWKPTSNGPNVPTGRYDHVAVWTGTEMIVWGGSDFWSGGGGPDGRIGGRYSPSTDSWLPTSTGLNAPATRSFATAVWTGTEMIVWGGDYYGSSSGGRYNPTTDTWATTSMGADVPSPRMDHTAVWTGKEMIVWGGDTYYSDPVNSGGRYNPTSDT